MCRIYSLSFWKCNFPINPNVRCWLIVCPSVCHGFPYRAGNYSSMHLLCMRRDIFSDTLKTSTENLKIKLWTELHFLIYLRSISISRPFPYSLIHSLIYIYISFRLTYKYWTVLPLVSEYFVNMSSQWIGIFAHRNSFLIQSVGGGLEARAPSLLFTLWLRTWL